jgi:hypothetical protein
MKTTHQLLILMVVISLMSCRGQLHVVTLYVDTAQIDQTSIDQHASFGQPAGIANKDFTTHVRKRDRIIWDAVSISNPSDEVKITAINHISGERIFERKMFYTGSDVDKIVAGANKIVAGKIKKRPNNKMAYIIEKYGLEFSVSNKDGIFKIDPVLKGHQ